jgi:hypothetical protein
MLAASAVWRVLSSRGSTTFRFQRGKYLPRRALAAGQRAVHGAGLAGGGGFAGEEQRVGERLGQLGLRFNTYQGPSSIQSALMEACAKRAVPAASLWGHAPHYVSGAPNPKVAHALLERLRVLLDLDVDLTPLEVAGRDLEAQIEQALLGRDDLRNYVRRLEEPIAEPAQESDSASSAEESAGPVSLPSAESIIDDLESLLRQIREDDEDEDVDVSDQEGDEG